MSSLPPTSVLLPRLIAPLIASLLALALLRSPSEAAQRTFVVAGSDGYGIDDCLTGKTGCGQMAADALCSAHGMKRATAFGSASDVTGRIETSAAPQIPPDAFIVSCSD
jgi:hypothetical protein